MELKLNVSIGATLQVRNAKGEWDWIKPEVGCEIKMVDGEIVIDALQDQFTAMWDNVVGPQFASVVKELISEQAPPAESPKQSEAVERDPNSDAAPATDDYEY